MGQGHRRLTVASLDEPPLAVVELGDLLADQAFVLGCHDCIDCVRVAGMNHGACAWDDAVDPCV